MPCTGRKILEGIRSSASPSPARSESDFLWRVQLHPLQAILGDEKCNVFFFDLLVVNPPFSSPVCPFHGRAVLTVTPIMLPPFLVPVRAFHGWSVLTVFPVIHPPFLISVRARSRRPVQAV